MKRIQMSFGLSAIALLCSLVGIVAAQQNEIPDTSTIEGPAISEPTILPNQTRVPIQSGTVIDAPVPRMTDNPFEMAPGQSDTIKQGLSTELNPPAASIPPTLNSPQSGQAVDPTAPAPSMLAPRAQTFFPDPRMTCPLGPGGTCAYDRERMQREFPLPPAGYVPYGGFGLDREYDYHRPPFYGPSDEYLSRVYYFRYPVPAPRYYGCPYDGY